MPNGNLVIEFSVRDVIKKIIFKGCGGKIIKYGLNILALASYVRYAMFIKELISKHGIKYVNLFKNTCIKIILKHAKFLLKEIGKIKTKIRSRFNWKRKSKKIE